MITMGTQYRRGDTSGAPNDSFLQNTLKTLFMLSGVLLDLQKCILSSTTKFVSFRSSQGNLSLFKITKASVLYYFSENFRHNLMLYKTENFSDFSVACKCLFLPWLITVHFSTILTVVCLLSVCMSDTLHLVLLLHPKKKKRRP